jgi:hypothetical protein
VKSVARYVVHYFGFDPGYGVSCGAVWYARAVVEHKKVSGDAAALEGADTSVAVDTAADRHSRVLFGSWASRRAAAAVAARQDRILV